MTISLSKAMESLVRQQLKISHLDKKVGCAVVETDKLNKGLADKLGQDVVENSDMILGFVLEQSKP